MQEASKTDAVEATVVDAKELEADLIQEQTQEQDPVQVATYLYATYYPAFIEGLQYLSAKGKGKVLQAMVEYPFNPDKYKTRTELERNIMTVGNILLEAKAILQMESFKGNDLAKMQRFTTKEGDQKDE